MVMADMQSANCKSKTATTASTRNVFLRTMSIDSRLIRRPESRNGMGGGLDSYSVVPLKLRLTPGDLILTLCRSILFSCSKDTSNAPHGYCCFCSWSTYRRQVFALLEPSPEVPLALRQSCPLAFSRTLRAR